MPPSFLGANAHELLKLPSHAHYRLVALNRVPLHFSITDLDEHYRIST